MFIILWRYLSLFAHFCTFLSRLLGPPGGGPDRVRDIRSAPEDAGTTLGDVFVHHAPLTRPLEVVRRACSTSQRTRSGLHTWELERIRSRSFLTPPQCGSLLVPREVEKARRATSRAAQAAPDAQTHHPTLPQHPPVQPRCHWGGLAPLWDALVTSMTRYTKSQKVTNTSTE